MSCELLVAHDRPAGDPRPWQTTAGKLEELRFQERILLCRKNELAKFLIDCSGLLATTLLMFMNNNFLACAGRYGGSHRTSKMSQKEHTKIVPRCYIANITITTVYYGLS